MPRYLAALPKPLADGGAGHLGPAEWQLPGASADCQSRPEAEQRFPARNESFGSPHIEPLRANR